VGALAPDVGLTRNLDTQWFHREKFYVMRGASQRNATLAARKSGASQLAAAIGAAHEHHVGTA
jgi:hypothetical protein